MTTVLVIPPSQIFERLVKQLPPWFGNVEFVPLPETDIPNPSTNFNNITWSLLITAFNAYQQLQYDWLQLRIGAFEIDNGYDPLFTFIPPLFPFQEVDEGTVYYPFPNQQPLYPIAFGDNLDLIAQDFFGNALTRRAGESDDNFRNRILANVMKPKATRPAMLAALIALVTPAFEAAGIPLTEPDIYEGWWPFDNGGYNVYQALAFGTQGGPNGAGAWGTGSLPYTCTIIVYLPVGNGLANYPGYSTQGESVTWGAGFGSPAITPSTPAVDIPPQWYGSDSLLNYYITESDIINLINLTKVLGTVCNLEIEYVT